MRDAFARQPDYWLDCRPARAHTPNGFDIHARRAGGVGGLTPDAAPEQRVEAFGPA